MTQTIVITSGKGGVGKTNISVNTAIELARREYRTCLFDGDLGLANVNILLGIDPDYTLDDYIFGEKNLGQVIHQTKFGVDVIPGSSGIEKMANLEQDKIADLVASFSQITGYDYFIIDTSSGISRGVIAFCLASTKTVIVITSEATSLTDAYALLKVMAMNNYAGTVKILVNRSASVPQAKETYLRFKEVANRHLKIDIAPAGIILEDPNIETSVTRQEPALILFPESLASQCIRSMVSSLIKNDTKEDPGEDFSDFWQRYFDFSLLEIEHPETSRLEGNSRNAFDQTNADDTTSLPPDVFQAEISPAVPVTEPSVNGNQTQEPLVPFARNGTIFDISILAIPVPILSKALELQARGELTLKMLLTIFSCEPALLTKALQMVCGPGAQGGSSKRVTSKHQVVKELGLETLTKLLCTTCIEKALYTETPPSEDRWTTSFWAHSYSCALLAESIAEIIDYPFPEEAFIAGLIHDIGRLALQTEYPEVYVDFAHNFRDEEALLAMEKRIFGMTHAQVGAQALRASHLDTFLVDAVQHHTDSFTRIETAFSLVKIVYLACRLNQPQQDETDTNELGNALFGLSATRLQGLITKAGSTTQQLADQLNIPLNREAMDTGIKREATPTSFRKQAMEYTMLQGALPGTVPKKELPEIIYTVFQAFDILFHIKPALCLMPDDKNSVLQAIDLPNCFGWGTLSNIQFSLKWENSLVVQSFFSGEMKTAMKSEDRNDLPLADRQMLRSLGSEGFVCVPLVAHGINSGVIVFGISKTQFGEIHILRDRLEQFGIQAAGNIHNLEKSNRYSISQSLHTQ
ncbi:MAG: HDOD domain-containing protein [Desulforhopalus sp.]